jgi:hypothetical protein
MLQQRVNFEHHERTFQKELKGMQGTQVQNKKNVLQHT